MYRFFCIAYVCMSICVCVCVFQDIICVKFAAWWCLACCVSDYAASYEGVSISFRTDSLERELQMIQLSATRRSCIAILWVSLVSFAAITLCVASERVIVIIYLFPYRPSPETFGYTLVHDARLPFVFAKPISCPQI
jgi:hypothetical protein